MNRGLLRSLTGLAREFGGLIAFWALMPLGGLRWAIAGALAAILLDGLWRWRHGRRFTRLWLFASVLTLVFGVVDLLAASPFLLAWEPVATNLALAVATALGARGSKPLIQEMAEQQSVAPWPPRPDLVAFFRLLTLAWAAYFLLKAAFCACLAATLPLAEAMAVRSVVGPASFALAVAVSITQGPRLFRLCRRLKLLPAPG
jgi:intracellular septation protein A